ncbi:class I SAM-dependent methyltransferase [Nonomuraea sp. NEAU-A123]|uniref:class I SAM-dependent methyltransferase n=1 Tax=Nonomuraea sp. NEAU-A123 TaxID=2839649 RepID=UPI001BE43CBB|nr:class I SAM-dependent methyltransferase [Nonomuraea sp. NEAU-A123]MBT2234448.1 methyltransferase domain-containing protein [Nonomuraea sp. NEAU-A123]
MSAGNAFTHRAVTSDLYRDGSRLAARTSALHRAKVQGRPVAEVIADLAADELADPRQAVVADIGCGRGTSTRILAERLRPRRLLAIDASAAMLAAARAQIRCAQLADASTAITYVRADFHRLPVANASCALVVAAFCLYHAPDPRPVISEIGRMLSPAGIAILATKSADSYRSLDHLVATAGIDPRAELRPSLYETAHGGNLETLIAPSLAIIRVEHEEHRFAFTGLDHVAAYLATSPKYELPPSMAADPDAIATALRARIEDGPVVATSTITYLIATRGDVP